MDSTTGLNQAADIRFLNSYTKDGYSWFPTAVAGKGLFVYRLTNGGVVRKILINSFCGTSDIGSPSTNKRCDVYTATYVLDNVGTATNQEFFYYGGWTRNKI